jgi:hypothetical protein
VKKMKYILFSSCTWQSIIILKNNICHSRMNLNWLKDTIDHRYPLLSARSQYSTCCACRHCTMPLQFTQNWS